MRRIGFFQHRCDGSSGAHALSRKIAQIGCGAVNASV
jgi:hypothetical protein